MTAIVENELFEGILTIQRWDAHFETDFAALRAVCFKSPDDEAHGASWINGL